MKGLRSLKSKLVNNFQGFGLEKIKFYFFISKDETSWSYGAAVTPGPRAARPNGLFLSATGALAAYLKSIKSTLNFNYDLAVGVTGFV